MPVICVFENENIKIYIYNFDHREPHIHIVKKGSTAKKGVDMLLDGTLPHGSEGLSAADIALVRQWLMSHVEEVNSKWDLAERGELYNTVSSNNTQLESAEQLPALDNVYVSNVIALPGKKILCEFNDGIDFVIFDMSNLLSKRAFSALNDDAIFNNIDCSNGVPNWNNEAIDIAPEHIYENGKHIGRREYNYLKFIAKWQKISGVADAMAEPVIDGFVSYVEAG